MPIPFMASHGGVVFARERAAEVIRDIMTHALRQRVVRRRLHLWKISTQQARIVAYMRWIRAKGTHMLYQSIGVLVERVLMRGMQQWKRQDRRLLRATRVGSATLIASMFRRWKAVRVVQVVRQRVAATRIQCMWRQARARTYFQHLRFRRNGARQMQRLFRYVSEGHGKRQD